MDLTKHSPTVEQEVPTVELYQLWLEADDLEYESDSRKLKHATKEEILNYMRRRRFWSFFHRIFSLEDFYVKKKGGKDKLYLGRHSSVKKIEKRLNNRLHKLT